MEAIAAQCKSLSILKLMKTKISDAGTRKYVHILLFIALQQLIGFKLVRLQLGHNRLINGSGLKYLADMPLEVLDLACTSITDASLESIAALTSLKQLVLSQTSISDVGIKYLEV